MKNTRFWLALAIILTCCLSLAVAQVRPPTNAVGGVMTVTLDGNGGKVEQAPQDQQIVDPFHVLAPPANDDCTGAELVPAAGPFPYLTAVTADITDATVTGDPPLPSCQTNISRTIWYSFTPTVTAFYTLQTCADSGTAATVDDTVMAVYTSSTSACGGTYTQVSGGCDDDSCTTEANQSIISNLTLTAGTKYFIVISLFSTTAPTAGNTAVQMRITQTIPPPPPGNDTCASPTTLTLNTPVDGFTTSGTNDYQLAAASTCYTSQGQVGNTVLSTAPGRDVVYTFTAPTAGSYSFRATGYATGQDVVLYLATSCPAGSPPVTVGTCLNAGNRNTGSGAEEVMCQTLGAGQQVFLFVDDNASGNTGSNFTVEANRCTREVEGNGTPALANGFVCGIEGTITPAAEADFFSIGTPPVNSRVFALADGISANTNDFDMRVNTTTDTLQYGDAAADVPFGSLSPAIGGTKLLGTASFLQMTAFSGTAVSEPYRVYAVIEPPIASAVAETEPNGTSAQASSAPVNYFTGTIGVAADADFYSFTATAGDLIFVGLDSDPNYDATSINGALTLFDTTGTTVLVTVNDAATFDPPTNRAPVAGLSATSPQSPAEALVWRARYTGTYYARVTASSGTGQEYALAISLNCQTELADLSVTKLDTPDPVVGGQTISYTITVSNAGPTAATNPSLTDVIPAGTTFESLVTPGGWSCTTPSPGGTGTVSCSAATIASGAPAVFTLVVRANLCTGSVSNTATVASTTPDPSAANNSANATTGVTPPNCNDNNDCTTDGCSAGVCTHSPVGDGSSCSDGNACTTSDTCSSGVCVGGPAPNCDDLDTCTTDSCLPGPGCQHVLIFACENRTATVGPGGTVTTDTEVDGSTPTDPIETYVTIPSAGTVTIHESTPTSAPPAGDSFFNVQSQVTAPSASPTVPIHLVFRIDASLVPPAFALVDLLTFKDGTPVANCTGPGGQAVPDPCVSSRIFLGDNDIEVSVYSSTASIWNFGFVSCNDNNTCTSDSGSPGNCLFTPVSNGTGCDDHNVCSQASACQAGTCTGSNPVTCTPIDACHVAGTCHPVTGCSNPNAPNGTGCSDGSSCTTGDTCTNGVCDGSVTCRVVSFPSLTHVGSGKDAVVPISVDSSNGVLAMDFAVSYDPAVVTPTGVFTTAFTNGFTLTYTIPSPGELRISLYRTTPVVGFGDVVWIVFHGVGSTGNSSSLTFLQHDLNESQSGFSSTVQNGSIDIVAGQSILSEPDDANGAPSSDVLVPITATPSTNYLGVDIDLRWNALMIQATGVTLAAGMPVDWTVSSNLSTPGRAFISAYGPTPLSGTRAIADVHYHVTGNVGDQTPLDLAVGAVNEGQITTVLDDGLFTICSDTDHDGFTTCGGDCNDSAAGVHPGAFETCDTIDNNCDGTLNDSQANASCNDSNVCTTESCNPAGSCVYLNVAGGTACGSPSSDSCDNPDTCNGFGTCQLNHVASGAPCGTPTSTDCDNADTCNGLGACQTNPVSAGTPCTTDGNTCTSDLCNGTGTCAHTVLADNTSCNDSNACTATDLCHSGVCSGTQVPAPTELNNSLLVTRSGLSTAVVSWTDSPGPYNVYRGTIRSGVHQTYNQYCIANGVPGPSSSDTLLPNRGDVFFYLVTRTDACGESIPGRNSLNAPIPNNNPCPGSLGLDSDGDGVQDAIDNCPAFPNGPQLDPDGDSHGTGCDNCPGVFNPDQRDHDHDSTGDVCDPTP